MSRYICPKCRRELSALQTCPWCAKVAVALTEVDRVSELQARVTLLEDLLRRYRDHHDDLTHEGTDGCDAGCCCSLCDEAHAVLEARS